MISKKDLKQYNFSKLEDYFNYILESEINGQFEQVEKLIIELSKPQRVEFLEWNEGLKETMQQSFTSAIIQDKCIKLLKL
jgi:hypothetical protein